MGFREEGEGLEGANRKKSKNLKNQEKIRMFSIGTALELTLNLFKF